eukprot:TRINITY_DN4076_c0_g1_i2.p1 TRINITY_DN4076_c0_g1~~TRINITY_DN4076_c0_g1_i2.p1  ORF type:complete len:415 (+),score=59.25 TRINITY_DN4076_c0_g1_i2:40-1245(+)
MSGVCCMVRYGTVRTHSTGVQFAGRFCVQELSKEKQSSSRALVSVDSTSNANTGLSYWALFVDDDWKDVYKKQLSCQDILSKSAWSQLIPARGELKESTKPEDYVVFHFWYLALVNCHGTADVGYTAKFTQVDGSQFSYDEKGLVSLFVVSLIFYSLLTAAHAYGCVRLWKEFIYHWAVRLLSICIGLMFFSSLFGLIHYGKYSNDGIGSVACREIGIFLSFAVEITLMFLLVLLSRGWAIQNEEITHKKIIFPIVGISALLFLILFILSNTTDPASLTYRYSTVPGLFILIIRFAVLGYFLYSLHFTRKLEDSEPKRNFFTLFGVVSSFWFLSLIFVAILGATCPAWLRESLVDWLSRLFSLSALAALAFLMSPSRARNYFSKMSSVQYDNVDAITGENL